jgi:hypothetical protein
MHERQVRVPGHTFIINPMMMKNDTYTKAVLTAIAALLALNLIHNMAPGSISFFNEAQAAPLPQDGPMQVVITGISIPYVNQHGSTSEHHTLPVALRSDFNLASHGSSKEVPLYVVTASK